MCRDRSKSAFLHPQLLMLVILVSDRMLQPTKKGTKIEQAHIHMHTHTHPRTHASTHALQEKLGNMDIAEL